MNNEIIDIQVLGAVSDHLFDGVVAIIDDAKMQVAVYVNAHASMTFWNVGKYIIDDMGYQTYSAYGKKILATLSQRLTARYGKGYTYSALTRMMKVARLYNDRVKVAQYLTCLPDKQWFVDKLNRSILIAKEYNTKERSD